MNDLERWQRKTCSTCDGQGELPEASEDYSPICNDEGITYPCEDCEDGKVDCSCDDPDDCDNEDCWEGRVPCESCNGNGYHTYTCDGCHEELTTSYYHAETYAADGALYCRTCVADAEGFKCPTCDGEGELSHESVKLNGRAFKTVAASCSCCGASPIRADDPPRQPFDRRDERNGFDHFVYKASMMDSDRVYFMYLCGDESGEGCLSEVLNQQTDIDPDSDRAVKLEVLNELLGDDLDGVWAMMDE